MQQHAGLQLPDARRKIHLQHMPSLLQYGLVRIHSRSAHPDFRMNLPQAYLGDQGACDVSLIHPLIYIVSASYHSFIQTEPTQMEL